MRFKTIISTLEGIVFGTSEITAGAPHFVDNMDIKRYMSIAIIALIPSAAAAVYFFKLHAVELILVSYISGGIAEVLFALIRKKDIEEGFLVTGLIFPLILPPSTPLWVASVGIIFGVIFGKELFGGTGRNIFNPALVGRLFVTISFPQIMTSSWQLPFVDTVTAATPLGLFKTAHVLTPYIKLLLGTSAGSMGETFRIGVIIGGLFLMFTRVSNWRIPFSYIGTVLLLSWIGNFFLPAKIAPPLFQLLSGGLLFGAMFMATDPVTSPYTLPGKLIFGFLAGIVTILIRAFSGYAEGVMFSIIMMNGFTPLIDSFVINLKYRPLRNER
ncbi:MAG: RnfABCDGE type electron transport complex subunit D [Spirochaetes bacterium]|nr:RnfABCDGE type electron transport complex subunit D [Spirochaetota bacterium]